MKIASTFTKIATFAAAFLFPVLLMAQGTTVTGGTCSGCDSQNSVTFYDCSPCVDVSSCKDLSNVVLLLCDGTEYKFDNLNQGTSGQFCSPDGQDIVAVWVKSGCNSSGDGPGYGRRFDGPCSAGSSAPPVPAASITAGSCTGCDSENTVDFAGCDSCVTVSSCKDLSNVVLLLCDGTEYKYDDLNQGQTGTFCAPDGQNIVAVWVKSGCNASGDGPGYGRRFDGPCGPSICDGSGGSSCATGGPTPSTRNGGGGMQTITGGLHIVARGAPAGPVFFDLQTARGGQVKMELLNGDGQSMGIIFDGMIRENETRTVTFHTQTLQPGMYFYLLSNEYGARKTGKMFIRK